MLSTIKALIKAPRIIQLNNKYKRELDAQYVSYDSWIKSKEEKYLAELAKKVKNARGEDEASKNACVEDAAFKTACTGEAVLPNVSVIDYQAVGSDAFIDSLSSMAASDIILFVNDESKLDSNASLVIASAFEANPEAIVIYGDEDEYNSDKTIRMNPTYRPDWSPETLRSYLYMGNVIGVSASAVIECAKGHAIEAVGAEKTDDTVAKESATDLFHVPQDIYDLIISLTEGKASKQVKHIDYVLYHNDYSKALFLDDDRFKATYSENELISIVIPSKDNPGILKTLLESMIRLTTGVKYEIIIIDNGSSEENKIKIEELAKNVFESSKSTHLSAKSGELTTSVNRVKYIYRPQEFNFSRICNQGAEAAQGKYVLFLNDDMEIRDSKWLLKMVAYASKNHVGAVGAKLYYPESKMIQHCGITNLRLGPVHKLQYKQDDHVYYDHVNDVDRNVLGVTGACLLMRKDLFNEIGGFDENFRVAFNDVDLCYTLYERGYSNVVVNTTHLWHYESLSRGDDESREKIERLKGERIKLYEKHPDLYGKDPYYHDYLTSDILDSNFTCAYEYEYDGEGRGKSNILFAKPKKINYSIKPEWENQCLIISLEQCGSLEYWLGPNEAKADDKNEIYLGGYSFVAGSDNSCFDFKILLKGESGIYELLCNHLYRPDLELNLDPEENAVLCGFSIRPDVSDMPKGEYQVGVIARGLAMRLTLCRFTNRYITIN